MKFSYYMVAIASILIGWHQNSFSSIENRTVIYSAWISTTRIVYDEGDFSSDLTIRNDNKYPMVIKNHLLNESKEKTNDFIVSHPSIYLNSGDEQEIKVIKNAIDGQKIKNKESLYWLCISSIPPNDISENPPTRNITVTFTMRVERCIKLFYRPARLPGSSFDAGKNLIWRIVNKKLYVLNNSPYYVVINKASIDGVAIPHLDYVPPFESRGLGITGKPGMKIKWSATEENGGESEEFIYTVGESTALG